ncbi:MAG: hypothetical protein D6696_09025 [Acidobacteria bacterium]|nr:MAG: hypothetical protein D6696_09025 [Acidobacteriota bacterium]
MTVGATSIAVGVIWDISWHRTIGRDTFWTPAHMAIYLGGIIGGLCGAYLALKTTFGNDPAERAVAVRFWGFRAPLGAWLAIWGAIAMLTSAPFDDWWHNAYGLDVEILSPPHAVLALGLIAICLGALLLALAQQNRRGATPGRSFGLTYAYLAGVLLTLVALMATEYRLTNQQHSAEFYLVASGLFPLFLIGPARAARLPWPATTIAAAYMALNLAMIWILPLFPAEPKLAPIYNPVTSMVVDVWPLLLVAPGLAADLLMRRWGEGRDWRLAVALAAAFLLVLGLVQWHFSSFLLSSGGDNWFFANDRRWDYNARPGAWQSRFWGDPLNLKAALGAFALAVVSTRLGLWWGGWMSRVKR